MHFIDVDSKDHIHAITTCLVEHKIVQVPTVKEELLANCDGFSKGNEPHRSIDTIVPARPMARILVGKDMGLAGPEVRGHELHGNSVCTEYPVQRDRFVQNPAQWRIGEDRLVSEKTVHTCCLKQEAMVVADDVKG